MKSEIKPLWIALAAIGAVLLIGVLYKVFFAEPPVPAAISKEEELKYKGVNAKNYAASYQQQNASGAQRGGSQGGYSGGAPR